MTSALYLAQWSSTIVEIDAYLTVPISVRLLIPEVVHPLEISSDKH
jgi:hypothetical protein